MSRRGKNEISQSNLQNIHDKKDKEFFSEAAAKGGQTAKKRRKFREIFEEILDDPTQTIIAQDFVDAIMDDSVPLKVRLSIFEVVLKILGEGEERLSSTEFSELSQHIKLEIV